MPRRGRGRNWPQRHGDTEKSSESAEAKRAGRCPKAQPQRSPHGEGAARIRAIHRRGDARGDGSLAPRSRAIRRRRSARRGVHASRRFRVCTQFSRIYSLRQTRGAIVGRRCGRGTGAENARMDSSRTGLGHFTGRVTSFKRHEDLQPSTIMYLTKVSGACRILCTGHNVHPFLGLAAAAATLMACRKSLLTDASNLRVGTFFSISFRPFSMRGSR